MIVKQTSALLALALFAGLAPTAQAGGPENQDEGFFTRETLLGDSGGLRALLAERGLVLELTYTGESFWNLRGGLNTRHAREYRGDISLTGEFDPSALDLWRGGNFFFHLQENHGHGITAEHVGDFQTVSNLDADDFKQVSEFWYRHSLLGGRAWIKVGKQETNENFGATEHGAEFLNSSAGFSPTIGLATFPDPGYGVAIGGDPVEWLSLSFGFFEGRSDGGRALNRTVNDLHGPLLFFEPSFHYGLPGLGGGHLRLGAWYNGDDADRFRGGRVDNTHGLYATLDQTLWVENPAGDDRQGLSLFAQYGWSPRDRSEVNHYFGVGLEWLGALPGRDQDNLGVALFHARFASDAGFDKPYEAVWELYYRLQLTPWLGIKPDGQVILNPGGTTGRTAIAVGVRVEVVF